MKRYEYLTIAAPNQGTKAKGVKSTADRFALSMTDVLNAQASEGWEYVRAETLPCDERKGLTGSQTTYQNVLVFRRETAEVVALEEEIAPSDERPRSMPTLTLTSPEPDSRPEPPLSRNLEQQD
ncbi:MAG: DUF4177 domain-containing protein [Boseongicola sp.]|nr:DUF4177 domain-containing protein [Boseongicola sp.]MDD9977158.1 DUF4177 domain-containing protein [Boseongicola sp.]